MEATSFLCCKQSCQDYTPVFTHYEMQAAIVKVQIKKEEKEIKLFIIRHTGQLGSVMKNTCCV